MTSRAEEANNLHLAGGFNCAQAVFAVFSEAYGMDKTLALKVAGGFGGGLRCGEVCGAASGAVMVIGLAHGQHQPGDADAKRLCSEKTMAFMDAFSAKFGALRCADLLGLDLRTEMDKFREQNLGRTRCDSFIAGAVALLEEQGY